MEMLYRSSYLENKASWFNPKMFWRRESPESIPMWQLLLDQDPLFGPYLPCLVSRTIDLVDKVGTDPSFILRTDPLAFGIRWVETIRVRWLLKNGLVIPPLIG